MSLAAPPTDRFSIPTPEGRRSTRVERTVPLVVLGQTKTGLSFQEKTATVSFNLHGCRYPSRHEYPIGSSIGLRVLQPDGETISPIIRAFVKSLHPPSSPRELLQVGVELESPANIWNISPAPNDWLRLLGVPSAAGLAAGTAAAPALEPPPPPAVAPPAPTLVPSEPRSATVTAFPAPTTNTSRPDAPKETATHKPERVAITIDQLVAAMQGKLQFAADKVVQNALESRLEEVVANAMARMESARAANLQQFEQSSAERFESLMRASREEILGHLEARLGEFQAQWADQQNAYRARAEEISQRLEKLAADARRNLTETQNSAEKLSREIEPQTRGRLDESLSKATDQFESAADRISDRQLIRVMEGTRMVTREAAAQLDARVAETRALMASAANSTIEELRRQAEVQVDLAVSETMERVRSALAALDAENRAVCESRRRAIVDEVARATEQSTEQFRSGIKAFLYSCLVAAVGAVDEHAKTTLEGLIKEPPSNPRVMSEAQAPSAGASSREEPSN
ncbi:MAG TPA: hypothetical protein VE077_12570 [Candidatus Methylomirabilis sp.]|nr:hypothetical protein [Candidatus Methylomirabilis sp.]